MSSKKPIAYVVEDNPDLANIFAEALNSADYEAVVIHDGIEAMSRIVENPPYLIMLDLHLPNFSGQDILMNIRKDSMLQDTRVFVTSADARMANGLRGPHTTILNKPVGFAQLQKLAQRFHPDQM